MSLRTKIICVAIAISLAGCEWKNVDLGAFKIPHVNPSPSPSPTSEITPKIIDSLKGASKDDCLYYAKFYLGLSEYIKHVKGINNTSQIAPPNGIIVGINKDYNWTVGKNKEFTDLIANDLDTKLDMKKPKEIDEALRAKLVETLRVYGEAAFAAANGK